MLFLMAKSDLKSQRKRQKIQLHFWNQVGAVEHISIHMLEDAIKKEFNCTDDRFIQAQIKLMQTEARLKVERVKIWIKQPDSVF